MNDRDGVYIEGELVASGTDVAVTYQGNDLTKPTSLQSSFSSSFTIPDSLAFRLLSRHAEQLDSGSRFPYVPLSAQIIVDGEQVFDGIAELNSFNAGWEVALYEEKRTLFDRLDRSIRTADLARYNHDWTLEMINSYATSQEGICYPFVDYGLLRDGLQPLDVCFPGLFVKTLIRQLLSEEGYSLIGDLPTDELYKRLVIPFSEDQPTSNDEQWQADRYARVTLQLGDDTTDRGTLGGKHFIDRIQPYNLDNIDTFSQGVLHNFNTGTATYVCDTAVNLQVTATQQFKAECVVGGIEAILSVEKNGNTVDSVRFEAGAGYNILFIRTDILNLNTTIKCAKGDRIQIRFIAQRQTTFGGFRFQIYNNPDSSFASFSPKLETSLGDRWLTSRNLPDLSGVQLLGTVAHLCCGTWLVNRRRQQVSFAFFRDIVNNTANALDWSNRLDTGREPGWQPRIDPYAQANRLTWKEIDATKKAALLVLGKQTNYGDGIIPINAPVLDAEKPLFELPFAASTDSDQNVPGYGSPVFIQTRTVSGTGSNVSINSQSTTARLVLVSLEDPIPVKSSRLKDDSVSVEEITIKLRPCWFGKRPDVVSGNATKFSLCFSPILLNKGEICLIDRYYTGLVRVLRRMRVLNVQMYLKAGDIARLDFRVPIRLQRVAVGSLVFSDGFYYLNKIENYQAGQTSSVTLIAF